MSKCNTCKHNLKFGGDGWSACDGCIHDTGLKDRHEPATNADHIRAMSDEELTKWLVGFMNEVLVANNMEDEFELDSNFGVDMAIWFKKPFKEETHDPT